MDQGSSGCALERCVEIAHSPATSIVELVTSYTRIGLRYTKIYIHIFNFFTCMPCKWQLSREPDRKGMKQTLVEFFDIWGLQPSRITHGI